MKSIYIILCRSGTLLSRIVYRMTGDPYTHVSLAFDEGLGTLYSSSRRSTVKVQTTSLAHRIII